MDSLRKFNSSVNQTPPINTTMTEDAAATSYYTQGSEEVAKETPLTLKKLEKVSEPLNIFTLSKIGHQVVNFFF
jgi:hypothetical protein